MASTSSDRSQKLVMGLGIVAILLLSANLITALVKHIWPEHQTQLLHLSSSEWEEAAPSAEVYAIGRSDRHRKFVIRHRHSAPEVHVELNVETDLDQELARLERRIEREAQAFGNELTLKLEKNEWQSAMESAKEALERAERSLARVRLEREYVVVSEDIRNK